MSDMRVGEPNCHNGDNQRQNATFESIYSEATYPTDAEIAPCCVSGSGPPQTGCDRQRGRTPQDVCFLQFFVCMDETTTTARLHGTASCAHQTFSGVALAVIKNREMAALSFLSGLTDSVLV